MKKLISLILSLVLCVSLCACGESSESDTSPKFDDVPATQVMTPEETEGATIPAETNAAVTDTAPEESSDGIRPEFQEAMDAYEAYYDEYCSFMEKYMENPTDLTLLLKYSEMIVKMEEMTTAFESWNEEEMSKEELKYYLEVNNRVTNKLIDVAG